MVYKWYTPGKLIDCSCRTLALCSCCLLNCQHTPTPGVGMFTPVYVLMTKYDFALLRAMSMRPMFTMVNHSVQVVHPWETNRFQLCNLGILLRLSSQLTDYTHGKLKMEYIRSVGEEGNYGRRATGKLRMVPLRMSAKHMSRKVRISLWLKHIVRSVSARRSMKIITDTPQSWPL
ncbi:hypothetical protein Cgig2_025588 [Carnegiea gigantea]|uniref:Uncharacterized protein n=1 Tax=Carnegiea gigantea TaxID=171969 RepID=A0A9Q1JQV1_9CARY|nr:hypothetical protein Cgig2_025588 [Carnegiea gigantea]